MTSQIPPAKRSRNAKRSSLACAGCKRAKRKCDIAQQSTGSDGCSYCRDKGEPCEVRYGDDKRRKTALQDKPNTLDMESRLLLLEELLVKRTTTQTPNPTKIVCQTVENSDIPDLEPSAQKTFEAQHDFPASRVNQHSNLTARLNRSPMLEARISETSPPADPAHFLRATDTQTSTSRGVDNFSSPEASTVRSVNSQADDPSRMLDKVISREGALDRQNTEHVKYFGPTSMYHLSAGSQADRRFMRGRKSSITPEPMIDIPQECDTSNEPEPVVMHLLDLFWTWQASHLQVFHRPLFLKEKRLHDTENPRRRYDFFSPSLLYAIMALASMISPDRGVRYQSTMAGELVGHTYFEKSRKLFDKEMGYPSVTTVQTALLIGSRYGALGQHSLGWTYSGIALRMAIEIGLHVNCQTSVHNGQLSPEIAQIRQLVFWGCYVQDKLWSAYCGRPSFIMDWDITVAQPEAPPGLSEPIPDPQSVLAGVHQNIVLLTMECSKILSELYSQKHHGDQDSLCSAARSIHGDLLNWHSSLPEALSWPNQNGAPISPHVLLMHMQFYFTLLLLHRPFINFSEAIASINRLEDTSLNPIAICTLAATNITKLTRDYSLFYDLRRIPSPAIHFVFVAATIHLLNYQIAGEDNYQFLLQGCLSALAEIGESYPNGQKAVSFLQELCYHFHVSRPRKADGASQLPSFCAPQQKQTRLSGQTRGYSMQGLEEGTLLPKNTNTVSNSDHPPDGTGLCFTLPHLRDFPDVEVPAAELGRFDWSNYNSPIALPSDLGNIDMETYGVANQNLIGGSTNFPGSFVPAMPPAGTSGMENFPSTTSGISNHDFCMEPAAAILDRFYGTACGLNQHF